MSHIMEDQPMATDQKTPSRPTPSTASLEQAAHDFVDVIKERDALSKENEVLSRENDVLSEGNRALTAEIEQARRDIEQLRSALGLSQDQARDDRRMCDQHLFVATELVTSCGNAASQLASIVGLINDAVAKAQHGAYRPSLAARSEADGARLDRVLEEVQRSIPRFLTEEPRRQ